MTTWAVGDYPRMAERLEPAAHRVVEAAGIEASDTVLDVATGTGNAALLAAGRGADVVGIDFEQTLLDIASKRCSSEGLVVRWVNADVGDLPVPDQSASAVLSVFGVMYAVDHEVAMRELARAVTPLRPCCPGIVGAWQLHAGHGSGPFAVSTATPGQLRTTEQMGRRRFPGGTRGPPLPALDGSFCRAAGAGLSDSGGGCGIHGQDCWPRDGREAPARQGAAVGCSPRRRPLADRDDGASNRRGNRHSLLLPHCNAFSDPFWWKRNLNFPTGPMN